MKKEKIPCLGEACRPGGTEFPSEGDGVTSHSTARGTRPATAGKAETAQRTQVARRGVRIVHTHFTGASLTIARRCEQPKCPPTYAQINKSSTSIQWNILWQEDGVCKGCVEGGMESYCLTGEMFRFGKVKKFSRWTVAMVAQQREGAGCH